MDWINCNTCCRQPGDEKDILFMLSSCGHIFCDHCLAKAESRNKCKVCSANCQLIQLSSKMKPDAEVFFQEPTDLLKKQNTQMNRLLEFQKEHRFRLVSFHRKILVKYKELERRYRLATDRLQQLEKENSKLKEMVTSGVGGGNEYKGRVGGISPRDSYQRAITASAMRNSPQGTALAHISPGVNRVSPCRLTLVKAKTPNRVSPNLSPGDHRIKASQELGRHPSPHMHARGIYQSPTVNNGMPMYQTSDSLKNQTPLRGHANGNYYQGGGTSTTPQQILHPQYMSHSQAKKNFCTPTQGSQPTYASRTQNAVLGLQDSPISRNMINQRQMTMPFNKY